MLNLSTSCTSELLLREIGKGCHGDNDDEIIREFSVASKIEIPWKSVRSLGIESRIIFKVKKKKNISVVIKISDLHS